VRPMEKIEAIRILQVDGLGGNGAGGSSRSPTDEVIEAALRYRVQAPMIDQVLKEIGIEGGSLSKLGGLMREAADMQRVAKEAGAGGEEPAKGERPKSGRKSGRDDAPRG
jgi:Flotillin